MSELEQTIEELEAEVLAELEEAVVALVPQVEHHGHASMQPALLEEAAQRVDLPAVGMVLWLLRVGVVRHALHQLAALVEEFLERRPWPSELPGPPRGALDGGLQRRTAVLHATPLGGSELGDL